MRWVLSYCVKKAMLLSPIQQYVRMLPHSARWNEASCSKVYKKTFSPWKLSLPRATLSWKSAQSASLEALHVATIPKKHMIWESFAINVLIEFVPSWASRRRIFLIHRRSIKYQTHTKQKKHRTASWTTVAAPPGDASPAGHASWAPDRGGRRPQWFLCKGCLKL